MKDYYLGLDIGTNSVGWAVTDEQYNLCRYKKKTMWGIRLFESANTAADRRMKRAARRRLQRRKQRIDLLQELFAGEMAKVDDTFFMRLNASRLYPEDKGEILLAKSKTLPDKNNIRHPLFIDENYSDIEYYKEYPTIFHLRKELMQSEEPHDIRLVYLAIHHILKNRGHFLIEGDLSNAKSFDAVFAQLIETVKEELNIEILDENKSEIEETIKNQNLSNSVKAKNLSGLFTFADSESTKEERKTHEIAIDNIGKLIAGNKGNLEKLLNMQLKEVEKTSFSFSDASYEEVIRPNLEDAIPEKCFLIDTIKAVYDWSVLVNILDGEEYLSAVKVKQYDHHKKNLALLRAFMKKYCTREVYKNFFDEANQKNIVNYASYVGSVKTKNKKISVKRCAEEDFYKELKKILEKMKVSDEDQQLYRLLLEGVETKTLLPLQRAKDNGIIPKQIHETELKKILGQAEKYLHFLKEKDEKGRTVSEKILKLFCFRVPYYVGPLSDRHKDEGANVWIKRKDGIEGKIYPWNFEDKVDLQQSNEAFIRRMTNKCTYLLGEDVIPKNSLLYSCYMVLNELNNLKIRGKDVSVGLKQDIYQNLFMKHRKVTREKLLRYLQESDQDLKKEDISGFDHDFKANLSSYMDFEKQVFGEKLAEDRVKKIVEDIIFWKTIYGDDSKMIESIIEQKCPEVLDREQLKTISRFRYKGWGNFSQEFLNGIMGSDKETGETFTIIEALWQTNCNLMQLLSERFTFKKEIERYNAELTGEIKEISYDALVKDLYVSPANKRAIWQTIQIVEEIRKIMGNAP